MDESTYLFRDGPTTPWLPITAERAAVARETGFEVVERRARGARHRGTEWQRADGTEGRA